MGRLILSLDGQTLGEYNMTKERYTIGRLPDNDIRVDNAAVSGHHSLIINILNDSFLEDLNSTNGTYVNGKLVKKHALRHGDVITAGHHQLVYEDDEVAATPQDEFERTMVIDPSEQGEQMEEEIAKAAQAIEEAAMRDALPGVPPPPPPAAPMAAPPAAALVAPPAASLVAPPAAAVAAPPAASLAARPAAALAPAQRKTDSRFAPVSTQGIPGQADRPMLPQAKLQVLSGTFAGRELELIKALTTLGSPSVQVAAITRRAEGFYIVHVESGKQNKYPRVNGQDIGPQARRLIDNDVIELAGVKMGFFIS